MNPLLEKNKKTELRKYLSWNDPLQNFGNKSKMGKFETKSTTFGKIIVLLAIVKAIKYKFFCLR